MNRDELELFIYNSFINYSKGIGKTNDDNEKIYLDILNSFNYKLFDNNINFNKRTSINKKDEFFKKISCKYYCKKNNKKIKDFIEYINKLEDKKTIKYNKLIEEINNKKLLQEKIYNLYISYLKDKISDKELFKEIKNLNINKEFKSTNDLINYIENESYEYSDKVINNIEVFNHLNNFGPLKTRLKKEGKISKYTNDEINIIKKIYNNFINYYDMNISYDEYILNENKLLHTINNNRKSYKYKNNSRELINYYLKNILNKKYNIDHIINNSNLYKKCFIFMEEYYNNIVDDYIEDFINTYRLNIYNYAYMYAKENNLLDEFNEFKNNKNNIKTINYKDIVNDFIKIGIYNIDDYLLEYDIDKYEFNKYIRYIKNKDNNLYVKYNSSIIRNKLKRDKYINNRINGLYLLIINGIPSNKLQLNREFKLLDYYIYCDKFLYEYDRINKLSNKILIDINSKYYDIINLLKEIDLKREDELLLEDISYLGFNISNDDKKNIINYLNRFNIPLSSNIFIDAIERYYNNNLFDLTEELLEIKELNYKKINFFNKIDDIEII